MGNFFLHTKEFDGAVSKSRTLANEMQKLNSDMDNIKNLLLFEWVGEGRNAFEKKYHMLDRQFGDLCEELWEIYEKLCTANEAYLQQDIDAAKQMDGTDNPY